MAEAHESRGLKIAVAALVTLSVILAVACYFLYNAYTVAEARRVAEAHARRVAEVQRNAAEAQVRPPATAPSTSPR
jgi:hypothetical protein